MQKLLDKTFFCKNSLPQSDQGESFPSSFDLALEEVDQQVEHVEQGLHGRGGADVIGRGEADCQSAEKVEEALQSEKKYFKQIIVITLDSKHDPGRIN